MSLHFAARDEFSDHGSDASLDNLDDQTWIFWVKPQQIDQSNRRFWFKSTVGGGGSDFNAVIFIGFIGGNGRFRYFRERVTTSSNVNSATNTVTLDEWQFFALVDGDGVAPKIYRGTLTSPPSEVSYAVQTTGSGAPIADAANPLLIGARDSGGVADLQSDAIIDRVWGYNRVLSLGEIRQHWMRVSSMLPGCVLRTIYGYDGTGTQTDYSGNGNHGTLNNTPDLEDPAPLPAAFWPAASQSPFVAAAGPDITGTLDVTEDDDTVASAAALAIDGTLAVTEADDTLSAAGSLPLVGTLAVTEADDTLSSASALAIEGTLAVTEDDDTLAAAAGDLSLATVSFQQIPSLLAAFEQRTTLTADIEQRPTLTVDFERK